MSNELLHQIEAAEALSNRLLDEKTETKAKAFATIRELEKRLAQTVIPGAPLRGLVNLATQYAPFYGARVRGLYHDKAFDLGNDPREILVIGPDGRLGMLKMWRQTPVVEFGRPRATQLGPVYMLHRYALDSDLQLEDLEAFTIALDHVLKRHVRLAGERLEKLQLAADLARRIDEVLKD